MSVPIFNDIHVIQSQPEGRELVYCSISSSSCNYDECLLNCICVPESQCSIYNTATSASKIIGIVFGIFGGLFFFAMVVICIIACKRGRFQRLRTNRWGRSTTTKNSTIATSVEVHHVHPLPQIQDSTNVQMSSYPNTGYTVIAQQPQVVYQQSYDPSMGGVGYVVQPVQPVGYDMQPVQYNLQDQQQFGYSANMYQPQPGYNPVAQNSVVFVQPGAQVGYTTYQPGY